MSSDTIIDAWMQPARARGRVHRRERRVSRPRPREVLPGPPLEGLDGLDAEARALFLAGNARRVFGLE